MHLNNVCSMFYISTSLYHVISKTDKLVFHNIHIFTFTPKYFEYNSR